MKLPHSLLRLRLGALAVAALLAAGSARALTIDTTPYWSGNVNNGWEGSGQSLSVGATETFFDSFSFYADAQSNGRTFDIIVSNALNGGSTLFSTSQAIATGLNTVQIDTFMAANSTVYVLFDYNGFTGRTLHYLDNSYAGGSSAFGAVGAQSLWPSLDHRFIAEFSAGNPVAGVPDSAATLGLLGAAMGALAWGRRKFARMAN